MQCSPYFRKYFETLYRMNENYCFDRLTQWYYNRTGIFQVDYLIAHMLAFSPDWSCYLTFMLRGLYTGKILAPKGLSQWNVKSITVTFVSQFGANFEIIVYWDCWLTLMFQKDSHFPENQTFRKSFFPPGTHVSWPWGYVHLITL